MQMFNPLLSFLTYREFQSDTYSTSYKAAKENRGVLPGSHIPFLVHDLVHGLVKMRDLWCVQGYDAVCEGEHLYVLQ